MLIVRRSVTHVNSSLVSQVILARIVDAWIDFRAEECFYNTKKVKSKRDSGKYKFTFIYLFVFDVLESGV